MKITITSMINKKDSKLLTKEQIKYVQFSKIFIIDGIVAKVCKVRQNLFFAILKIKINKYINY